MPFNHDFFLMQREGFITESCICTAFNELLGATVSQKGPLLYRVLPTRYRYREGREARDHSRSHDRA